MCKCEWFQAILLSTHIDVDFTEPSVKSIARSGSHSNKEIIQSNKVMVSEDVIQLFLYTASTCLPSHGKQDQASASSVSIYNKKSLWGHKRTAFTILVH